MKTCHGGSDTWTNNKEKICIVEVIRDTSDNRLYVHEAFSIEKLLKNAASNSVRDGNAVSPHSQGAVAKVLQEIVNSRDSSKIVDENGNTGSGVQIGGHKKSVSVAYEPCNRRACSWNVHETHGKYNK